MNGDLTTEALEAAMPGRPIRSYAALVSTASVAHGWANDGAPAGALVVADHHISPRGHAGRPWKVPPGQGLGFSIIMRPAVPAEREGWLYSVLLVALADVLGGQAGIEWPDEVWRGGAMVAAVGVTTRIDSEADAAKDLASVPDPSRHIAWAIADVLVPDTKPPRADLLRRVLEAIETREASASSSVVRDYDSICTTLGRRVSARLRAGTGPRLEGKAIATIEDGAIVLETPKGLEVPVRPQDVRRLEPI